MRDSTTALTRSGVSRRTLLRGAAGLAAGGALLAGGAGPATAADRRAPRAVSAPESWMAALPDARTLDDLTIPGTHNSCATVGGPFDTAKCQDLSLPELLGHGVRYLDIRCRPIDGAFAIHHGLIYQNKNFNDVLSDCRRFLTDNPGETVLMSVQQEHSDASPEEFASIFNGLYMEEQGFEEWFHREPGRIPTLGETRGKIVLVAKASGIGGLDRFDSGLLFVQDEWKLAADPKWERIQEHLDASAAEAQDTTRLAVNYVSTTGGELLPLPRRYAEDLNPRLATRLDQEYEAGARPVYGAVLLDFAATVSPGLPEALYRLNEAG